MSAAPLKLITFSQQARCQRPIRAPVSAAPLKLGTRRTVARGAGPIRAPVSAAPLKPLYSTGPGGNWYCHPRPRERGPVEAAAAVALLLPADGPSAPP